MTDTRKPADSKSSIPMALFALAGWAVVIASGALVFLLARPLEWTLGWIYASLFAATLVINFACLLRWNPELIRRRARLGKGTKTWDKVWLALFTPLVMAVFVVAVLEARQEVASTLGAAWLLGFAIFVPGWVLATWSMVVNPFFEKTVRIQTDHGHHVIDTGLYAYVRHPGYVGFVGWMLSTPLLLASNWAFVPALLAVVWLVIRTALEDRTLQAELPGYAEYAARVRFRLIPRVW